MKRCELKFSECNHFLQRASTPQVVLVVVDPAGHFIGQLNGFDGLNLCVRSHHVGGDGVTDCCGEGLHLASTQVGDVRQVGVSLEMGKENKFHKHKVIV